MGDERFRLRIRYTKGGRLKYLSHLEVVRCMERCIRRAGLPFMVSQGFSPHMRTAFGWALPVGVAGLDEYLDVLLHEYIAPRRVLESLRPVTPRGIEVLDAYYIDPRAKAPDAEYPYSLYECAFAAVGEAGSTPGAGSPDAAEAGSPDAAGAGSPDAAGAGSPNAAGASSPNAAEAGQPDPTQVLAALETALDELLAIGHILVKRKKKEKVVEFEGLLPERPQLAIEDGRVVMRMLTFTEGKGSLRPDLFCAELLNHANIAACAGSSAGINAAVCAEGAKDAMAPAAATPAGCPAPIESVGAIELKSITRTEQRPLE